MRDVVKKAIQAKYPLILGPDPSLDPAKRAEQEQIIADFLDKSFDVLLRNMLRKETFLALYFEVLSAGHVSGDTTAIPYLQEIALYDKGVFYFGDVAYLKLANNLGRPVGDALLHLIAAGIECASFVYYGRYREGDEFVLYHPSFEVAERELEVLSVQLSQNKDIIPDLPVSIDFGHAEHREVAVTYLLLLQEGWRPDEGRSATQVFYDIAERIAEIRSSVRKIYNRAWLLYDYLEIVFESQMFNDLAIVVGQQREKVTINNYNQFLDSVTRGGKFVTPEESWLTMTKDELRDHIHLRTLELLSPPPDADLFTRMVTERAESIYLLTN